MAAKSSLIGVIPGAYSPDDRDRRFLYLAAASVAALACSVVLVVALLYS
jgi:hypothetical protein